MLPALLEAENSQSSPINENQTDRRNPKNLLDWVRVSDNQEMLDKLYKSCKKGLVEVLHIYHSFCVCVCIFV